jgi:hypothetical protein
MMINPDPCDMKQVLILYSLFSICFLPVFNFLKNNQIIKKTTLKLIIHNFRTDFIVG